MLLITGATGNLGSSVVNQLLKISAAEHFIVTSSKQEGVDQLIAQGLQARLANFSKKETLIETFKGIHQLLLVSTMDQNRFEQHQNVIDVAKEQGVKHIVYTSLAIRDIQTSGVKDLMLSHFQTEDYLIKSGLNYTILRNTMYADALTQILGPNALQQAIKLPGGNGKVPYVLRREMGEATANLLLQQNHINKIYNIVGTKAYGYKEVAQTLSKLTGNSIDYINISDDDLKNELEKIGFPDFAIYLHSGTLYDVKTQQYEIESKALEELLGRPSASIDAFLKELFNL